MYEFWNDYENEKYGEKARLCYMDTDSFIIYEGTDGIYKDISEDFGTIFLILQTMNQTDHYQNEKTKKSIGSMKDELGRKIMKKLVGLRAKTYNYLIDDEIEDKESKGTKSLSYKENFMKTVQMQLNLKMK